MIKMEIENIDVGLLIPYDNNPRLNDGAVDGVAASISNFGFRVPIVIDQNNVIVCGHTRLKAALKLGLQSVPCIRADDLSDEQIKAFRLADNKVSEAAEWDMGKLSVELAEIDGIEMEQFGFEDIEIGSIGGGADDLEEDNPFEDIEKLEKHYGVPYQGNKSRIADIIISLLPAGKRLVDLFGGGGAITHCGMLSGKWDEFLYNDINPLITQLFMDAAYGKYHDERRVITRNEFNELKDTDPYVAYLWSFGNSPAKGYLWGEEWEDIKCTICHVMLDETLTERRAAYAEFMRMLDGSRGKSLKNIQPLQYLQALTRLESLQRLESLNIDYHDYVYRDGDVVYCDVPYERLEKGKCSDYGVEFDSLEFYEWVKSRDYQVFFSSYEISDKSFYSVKLKKVMSLIGATTNGQFVNEYLYSNRAIE